MFYSLLFLTALLSQLQGTSAAVPVVSTQIRAVTTGRPSIAALNNLVVIGDASGGTTALDGDISFSFYSYTVTAGVVVAGDYAAVAGGTTATITNAKASTIDLAGLDFKGLGHDVAIADMSTVFVAQSSKLDQTGRVIVYEGNVTDFKQTQLLIPYDGKHRLDSSAFFGESIAAKNDALAVGCQNCNSSAPIYSGAVYVYKPNKEGRWSESQVLSADGVLFMGEQVAMHERVLVATGDDSSALSKASLHNYDNVANTVVVFEEEKGPLGKFEQRQVITLRTGNVREEISGVTVFDETIAITTKGVDTGTAATVPDKVYIFYPMNKRYGMEQKGKPSPQQWTNIQILTSATATDVHYVDGAPDTSLSMNNLQYLTTNGAAVNVALASASRPCMSCKYTTPLAAVEALTPDFDAVDVVLTSDATAFYSFQTVDTDAIDKPTSNSYLKKCLTLELQDQYNDGWGTASLVVTSPNGHEDKFTLQCTTANPNIFKYCPESQDNGGKYHLHIENGEETPFGWEIMWKVQAGSSWYYGDRHTHMDFIWDEKYQDFHAGAIKGLLPQVATCKVCDPNKPTGKHRSLSNLRSLHHKGSTSSPTMTMAPTLAVTGYGTNDWNEFTFIGSTAWFDSDYNGAAFFISDKEGKHLLRTGTSCTTDTDQTCWVELPDGDYTLRAGASVADSGVSTLTFAFCNSIVKMDTQLHFTVLNQQCYAGLFITIENTCLQTYYSEYYLNVDIMLGGGAESLSSSDESSLKIATAETMLSVLGSSPSSIKVGKQEVTSSGLQLSMVLQFASVPDSTALDNLVAETSSASSLLKYELIGSQSLSGQSNFLKGAVSSVTILSASTNADAHDFSKVDESAYETVTDHVWKTASVEAPSDNFNVYARYVAEGAYALVAVAAVLAVSLFAKRAMTKTAAVVEEDTKA